MAITIKYLSITLKLFVLEKLMLIYIYYLNNIRVSLKFVRIKISALIDSVESHHIINKILTFAKQEIC